MRRSLAVAVALASSTALLLAGCSQQDVAGSIESSSGSSEPRTTNSPTTTPTPSKTTAEPPAMPALAKQQSNAGAKAFIRHYIDVLNHAYAVPDPDELRQLSDDACQSCESLIQISERLSENGGRQVGGEWHPTAITTAAKDNSTKYFVVEIRVDEGYSKRDPEDRKHHIKAHGLQLQIGLTHQESRWSLAYLAPA